MVVKPHEAIVDGVKAECGANVPQLDAGKGHVILEVTQLDDEGVGTVVLPANEQPCHNRGVVGSLAQAPRPPLGGGEGRGVQDELAGFWVKGCGCLEATQESSVT